MTNPEHAAWPVAADAAPSPAGWCEPSAQRVPMTVGAAVAWPAPSAAGPRARLAPLAPERYALQVTVSGETHDKLRYAQELLGHAVPTGDVAQVLDRALDALIAQLEKRRFATVSRSRPASRTAAGNARHIPAAVRRAVWQRDNGRCTFVSESGRRCPARGHLELDHAQPVARGGLATVANLRLRCRAHNQYDAECAFGAGFMHRKREEARRHRDGAREPQREREGTRSGEAGCERPAAGIAQDLLLREREAAARARREEVIPWLRAPGFRADEARRAAETCADRPDAPLEARVRAAIASLAPPSARRVPREVGSTG